MLDTIPLKKNNTQKANSKNNNSLSSGAKSNIGGLNSKNKLNPWVLILLILVVVVTGIVVYRSTRASSSGVNSIPQSITDIQNYIDSLAIVTPNAKSIEVSNYAEFTYVPKTTEEVSGVGYYIDGNLYATVDKSPYNISIDTSRISNGKHDITAVAFNGDEVPVAAVHKTISVSNNQDILKSANNIITYPWNRFFRL